MLNPCFEDLILSPFARVAALLDGVAPPGGVEPAARDLWAEAGIHVFPGGYLRPQGEGLSRPGAPYIRLALVHEVDTFAEALTRVRRVLN